MIDTHTGFTIMYSVHLLESEQNVSCNAQRKTKIKCVKEICCDVSPSINSKECQRLIGCLRTQHCSWGTAQQVPVKNIFIIMHITDLANSS